MIACFECKRKAMFLVRCWYDDMYEHYDGEEKERWVCLKCLKRRLGFDFAIEKALSDCTHGGKK
jgi:hypothetical protein